MAKHLDDAAVVAAYARWAPVYDAIFGVITNRAIRATMAELNVLPAGRILEVGVGTGIALPLYKRDHRVTGIDLSPDMLARAERKVAERGLTNVDALSKMDAAALAFADVSFDAAVAMFVMSVVPDPRRALAEMVRVVRPGGRITIVNHFAADGGMRAVAERWLAPYGASLGWHPEFSIEVVTGHPAMRLTVRRPLSPLGLYTLLMFERT
jgi:phosphatidylethanolamine/phosphatidyl-N-methylethanolamine N-methyltransferase